MDDKLLWVGKTEDEASPVIRISITASNAKAQEFEAIIDTGFTGFLSIPQQEADRLGLVPISTQIVVFADNSEHVRWIANAIVIMGHESQEGAAFLEPFSNEVLLGMEFIRKFDRMMLLYPTDGFVQFVGQSAARSITSTFRP
jgi:clan AA aspartic protease